MQLFCNKEKIKIGTIPFKSGSEAMTNLLGGHTDLASSSLASLGPQLKAGALRGLAISSKQRHSAFPTIPTTAELGYPDVDFVIWYALFAPAGVPQQVTDLLVPSMAKVEDRVRRMTQAEWRLRQGTRGDS
jgi:tripartite-type tricarboxylate transporter receptor subunit TctC